MPNHVHAVVTPNSGYTLSTILHSWKSFSAHQINKNLQRKGHVKFNKALSAESGVYEKKLLPEAMAATESQPITDEGDMRFLCMSKASTAAKGKQLLLKKFQDCKWTEAIWKAMLTWGPFNQTKYFTGGALENSVQGVVQG